MILRWRLGRRHGIFYPARALAEWFFVVAGTFVSVGFFSVLFAIVLCPLVMVLRHLGPSVPLRGSVLVVWGLLLFFAVDSLTVLVLFLYHAGWVHLFTWAFLAALGGFLIGRFPVGRLRPYHGVMVAMVLVLLVQTTVLNMGPGASTCARDKSERNLSFVLDHGDFPGLKFPPRFLVTDLKEENLFVAYRFPFFNHHPETECQYGMLRVGLNQESAPKPVDLACGEVIGLVFDPWAGRTAALLVYNPTTVKREGIERHGSWLVWIDSEGRLKKEVFVPDVPWNEYYCSMIPTRDGLWLYTGESAHMLYYDRTLDKLSRHPTLLGGGFFLAHTKHTLAEGRLYTSYAGSLLTLMLQPGIAAVDLAGMKVLHTSSRFLCGTHEVAYDAMRQEVYTNSFWSGTLQVLDLELDPLRRVRVGGLVRALALDTERRTGYALRYITGELFAFDLDSGEVLGSTRISKGGRALRVLSNGDILVGSGCGVARIKPQQLTAQARKGLQSVRSMAKP